MNKNGEVNKLGVLIMIFIVAIVALALFTATADASSDVTNLRTATLANYTTAAAVNSSVTLTGREATTTITVVNASNVSDVWTANFELVETNSDGRPAILLKTTDAAGAAGQNGSLASVTYSYKPQGYDNTVGGRAMMGLTLIMAALAIALAMVPGFREWLSDKFNL
jgi:hypothetical protein